MNAPTVDAAGHMDRIYRYQRFIYDLTRKPYLLGRDALIGDLAPPQDGAVLEIACGTGRNLIRAAQRYPAATFFGLDVSSAMLATAGRSIATRRLDGRIRIAKADATAFDPNALFGRPSFDRVFISYALSMIPDWRQAVAAAVSCLAEGGSLHVVDFGQQENLPGWFRAVLVAWLARFDVAPRAELRNALEMVARTASLCMRFEARYRGYAYSAVLSRGP